MRKLILIKYASEIFLKGLNKKSFEQKLLTNIKRALKGLDYEFSIDQNRWLLYSENLEEVIERVRKVFGIKELDLVTEVDANLEAISEEALREIREVNPATFKVETKRANKKFPMNSMEASRKVGAYILRNSKRFYNILNIKIIK